MSDLGNLSQCIVDNDPEVRARARGLRRKALVASVCVEAVCLGAMLLWPLITPGVLPSGYIVTPVPPYHGGGGSHASHPNHVRHHGSHPVPRPNTTQIIFTLRNTPNHAPTPDEDFSTVGEIGSSDLGSGTGPEGPGVPGGSGDGRTIVVPRPPEPVQLHRQKMSEGVMEGSLIHRVKPDYPVIARTLHLSGAVRLRAIIATEGSVQNLEVLSGHPILAQAAKDAVRQWCYRPTLLSGVPVEVETYITVNFVLGDQ